MADSAAVADLAPAVPYDDQGLAGHPRGLSTLFLTEMWERLSYYGMRALLILFMTAPVAAGGLAFPTQKAAAIYGLYTAAVYFTSIPGGWIADRLLGLRNAVLAGGILIALGHYSMFVNRLPFFYAGLVLIVLGTGLLKGNISAIVGSLYAPDDKRRDAGFSIFYMGINTGALIGPIICGTLGEKVGWHWGFGAAGIGMTFGVVQYVLGQKRFGDAGLLKARPESPARLWAIVVAGLLALVLSFYFFWDYRDWILLLGTIVLFTYFFRQAEPGIERKRVAAIIVLFVFATLFWGGFEQAGSSLNLFARDLTDRVVGGWEFPASWFQSVNSFFLRARPSSHTASWAWGWASWSSRAPRWCRCSPAADG
jgi:POT family proton-dependent oligopeptide transporter